VRSRKQREGVATLLRVLGEQRRALIAAGCSDMILHQYQALIQFLQAATPRELEGIFGNTLSLPHQKRLDESNEKEMSNLSDVEIEGLVNEARTPRTTLEKIAIYRFRVPRGSMRSFSNREMLVEKILTLLQNEQAHRAIEKVARGQGELPGMRPKR